MKSPLLVLNASVVIAMALASGLLHGRLSHRWGPSPALESRALRLNQLPNRFGAWRLRRRQELDEQAQRILQCAGCALGSYENEETGDVVTAAVLLGPSGPLSVHTPEICYSGRDYHVEEPRQRVDLGDAARTEGDSFWSLLLKSRGVDAHRLRVCYAWSAGRNWKASRNPRFEFAGQPFLYKVQVAGILPPRRDDDAADPCRAFLRDLTPVLAGYLAE